MLKDFTIANMLDMTQTIAGELFQGKTYPWEVLPEIGDFIVKLGKTLDPDEYDYLEGEYLDCEICQGCTYRLH